MTSAMSHLLILHRIAATCAVFACMATATLAAPANDIWTGTTVGPTSGIRYSWRLESKERGVAVSVTGDLNGTTYPIQCTDGRYIRSREFVATCRYIRAAPGIIANTAFELQADLSGDTTSVTYRSGSYVNHFTLARELAAQQSPSPPTSKPPEAQSQIPATGRYILSSSRNRLVLDIHPPSGQDTRFLLAGGNVRGQACFSGSLEWRAAAASYAASELAGTPGGERCVISFLAAKDAITVQEQGNCFGHMGVSVGSVSGVYRKALNEPMSSDPCP